MQVPSPIPSTMMPPLSLAPPPPTLRVQPDIEALVINFLRTQPDMTATAVGTRTFGRMPDTKTFPLQVVTRITSSMLENIPGNEFEQVTIQIDTWGGTKADTQDIHQIMRAALALRLVDPATINGIIAADLGGMGYLPDQDFEPAKARYTSDVLVTVRPTT